VSLRHPSFDSSDDVLGARVVTELDLHGRTQAEAERDVRSFIATAARAHSGSVVRIITGKGRNSPGRLQALNGQSTIVPSATRLRPNPDYLAERFERFRAA